jgi:hypothetical protein
MVPLLTAGCPNTTAFSGRLPQRRPVAPRR